MKKSTRFSELWTQAKVVQIGNFPFSPKVPGRLKPNDTNHYFLKNQHLC
jgi:hypothetical protein